MSLYIFDKDGTLIKDKMSWMGIHQPVLTPEMQVLLPGVWEKLAELRAQGHKIGIASNQGAVSKGIISLDEAEKMMENVIAKLGGVDAWLICPYDENARDTIHGQPNPYKRDNDCRKPKPGMLLDLMKILNCPPEETIMVGDSWRDRKAAENAGVGFVKAREFFGRKR